MGTLWWEHSSGIPAMGTLQRGENGGVNTLVDLYDGNTAAGTRRWDPYNRSTTVWSLWF